jgi:hypothetical protein
LKITQEYDTKISSYGLAYYYTFLGKEAVEALRDHMNYRVKKGWVPTQKSNVWGNVLYPSRDEQKHDYTNVWKAVKKCVEKAGLPRESVWTHCLRKSFQKSLNACQGLDEDTKESLMGHILPGSRDNYLDYHDLEEIRAKYGKVSFGRESSAEVNTLKEDVDSMRRENRELKADMALQASKKWESEKEILDQWRRDMDDMRENQRTLLLKFEAAQAEIEKLKKKKS